VYIYALVPWLSICCHFGGWRLLTDNLPHRYQTSQYVVLSGSIFSVKILNSRNWAPAQNTFYFRLENISTTFHYQSFVCPCVHFLWTFHDGCKQGIDQQILIRNRFHVKLRIFSPENCKQSLQVKSWKAEVTAEIKQTQDYNQNFVIQAHKS